MMKVENGVTYYSIGEVGEMIEKSPYTIKMWFAAKKYAAESGEITNVPLHKLPEPRRDLDITKSRFWSEEEVMQLKEFSTLIRRGDLAFYNRGHSWGDRGKMIQERYDLKEAIKNETGEDVDKLLEAK